MAKQTGLDKKTVLNICPSFLIVPASLELKAEQLVAQNLVPADTAKVVPQSIRALAPIVELRLDAASETAWYLAASPNQIDTIKYAYLEGQQGAYIETRNGFDVWTGWKSSVASTSVPRPSTGAASTRIRARNA